jgi:small subunit ribosomal protein S2
LEGIRDLQKRPDAMVIVDTRHEAHATKEASAAGIPVIGIMSSDCNIRDAAYPIAGNDSSRETVTLLLNELAAAYETGRKG